SRQVYKGMDIGTGKVTKKEMAKIPHHLLDVASPKKQFTVVQYKKLSEKAIKKIHSHKKIPIICGGTGFYIQTITDNIAIPEVKPDAKLRAELEKKSAKELFNKLKKLDPRRAKNIDKNNRRRLIRALEIVIKSGKKIPILKSEPKYEALIIGIKRNTKELKELIKTRLLKRLKQGMVKEIINLKKSGLSWKRLEDFGLECRYVAYYLQNKLSYNEMVEKLQKEIEHYAKRQMTWFKKDKRIRWVKNLPANGLSRRRWQAGQKQAEKLVKEFFSRC
ncbi:MAG: tRNA (adenosine(37)-N6)-dimethylallyltransferase MiaA, partial [Candidatus Azambacteria bacterium]|nr:tRNA (adenosine(37)-N6)-dimethylallyltransferase MiaA [Candidatus Azambacteria bacterium]